VRLLHLLPVLLLALALPARAEIAIQEVTSPGGITAWLVEERGIPFTALELRFQGGTSLDLPGKRGEVNLMAALLEEGTGDLDSQGFAAARDDLAAEFRFSANRDSVSVSAKFLTENRDRAIDLLRGAIIAPRFDQDAIDRVRGQVITGIRSDAQDPEDMASRSFSRIAFGDHPYGSSESGTEESVSALTRDDIVAAHRATMARDRLFVAAVGDITAEELGLLLDRLLGDLPETGRQMPARADWLTPGGIAVTEFATPQSVILFGHEGIERDAPDFFAAFIANEVLGGGRFGARLMTELREERGLTYGVSTYLVPMDHAAYVMGQMATGNATVGASIDLLRSEWRRLATEGVTADELAATKTYLTGSYPLRFDGNGPIADILVGMQMEGLPIDYVTTRNARIEAVTLEDVNRVAASLFRPDALQFVVVGQPEGVVSTN
jgi:zinc protease